MIIVLSLNSNNLNLSARVSLKLNIFSTYIEIIAESINNFILFR